MLVFKHKVERRDDSFSAIKYYKLRLLYSARVSKLTSRPTGLSVEQVGEESVEHGDERGAPSPSSESTTDTMVPVDVVGVQSTAAAANPAHNLLTGSHDLVEAEREKDGALGVPGGQPDVPPSGPNSINSSPEPKVKILFELGTRHD